MQTEVVTAALWQRSVEAVVASFFLEDEHTCTFRVDCLTSERFPQAFVAEVTFEGAAEAVQLSHVLPAFVVLDEEMARPAYLFLSDGEHVVSCTIRQSFGQSNVDFSFR